MHRMAILVMAPVMLVHVAGAQAARPDTADPYRWLEDVNGAFHVLGKGREHQDD